MWIDSSAYLTNVTTINKLVDKFGAYDNNTKSYESMCMCQYGPSDFVKQKDTTLLARNW